MPSRHSYARERKKVSAHNLKMSTLQSPASHLAALPTTTNCPHPPQGAYNQYYEADVRAWRLPSKFNAKPYHAAEPTRMSDVAIVHFHGPKPADYLEYANSGACPKFGDMCRAGVAARACMYTHEWVRRLEGDEGKEAYDRWRSGCAKA
jgi:hypothetical protein